MMPLRMKGLPADPSTPVSIEQVLNYIDKIL